MEVREIDGVLARQAGIVSRRQLGELGATQTDLRRWLRRRELVPVLHGVYVDHTGPLTWSSRAWAGVQRYWPAALAMESAVRLAGDVVHVAVAEGRPTLAVESGVVVHRLRGFDDRVQWNRTPPRQRYEDALLSMCSRLPASAALELVSEGCRSRRTTPARLRAELAARTNLGGRRWLLGVLADAADGVQSVLESTYLRRVERAHGLPPAERQVRMVTAQGVVYRDVLHRDQGVVVELDGRLWHDDARTRAADLSRDLEAAAGSGLVTLRIGWHQAEMEPCVTARWVGEVLRRQGWRGRPRPCGPSCRAIAEAS